MKIEFSRIVNKLAVLSISGFILGFFIFLNFNASVYAQSCEGSQFHCCYDNDCGSCASGYWSGSCGSLGTEGQCTNPSTSCPFGTCLLSTSCWWDSIGGPLPTPTPGGVGGGNNPPTCDLFRTGGLSVCVGDMENYTADCYDSDGSVSTSHVYYTSTSNSNLATGWTTACTGTDMCSGSVTWNTAGDYYVAVDATDNDGALCSGNQGCPWSPAPSTISCTGAVDCTSNDAITISVGSIAQPTGLTASTGCSGITPYVFLEWNPVMSACGGNLYNIRRCSGSGCTGFSFYDSIAWSPLLSPVQWNDPSVADGTTYRYEVRGNHNGNVGPLSSRVSATTPDCSVPPPGVPVVSCVVNSNDSGAGDGSITCSWGAVSGATEYRRQVDGDGDINSAPRIVNNLSSGTSVTRNNLSEGTYQCRARVTAGSFAPLPGDWSNIASCTVTGPVAGCNCGDWINGACGGGSCAADRRLQTRSCNPPGCQAESRCVADAACVVPGQCATPNLSVGGSCDANQNVDMNWSWNINSEAIDYTFQMDTLVDFSSSPLPVDTDTAGNSVNVNNQAEGVRYYGRVQIIQASGCAAPSNWGTANFLLNCAAPTPTPTPTSTPTPTPTPTPPVCQRPNLTASGTCTMDGELDIDWSWTSVLGALRYRFRLPGVADHNNIVGTSYSTKNLTPGNYTGEVRVELSNPVICRVPSLWDSYAFSDDCMRPIQGRVFEDPFAVATIPVDRCFLGGASGIQPGAGSSVTVSDGANNWSANVQGTGSFSVSAPVAASGSYLASLSPSANWICSCPRGCIYGLGANIGSPDIGVDYYVTQRRDPWAQTIAGDVHAENNIKNPIPDSCAAAPSCSPYFSLAGGQEVGVITYDGPLAPDFDTGSASTRDWVAKSGYEGADYSFAFWRKEAGIDVTLPDCTLNGRPDTSEPHGTTFEVNCNSDFELDGFWLGNKIHTIFVNFDSPSRTLTLNPVSGITNNPQGLLTIITNGNIQVGGTVTQIEGIYLADGSFTSCDGSLSCTLDPAESDWDEISEVQLNVTGSVIAWGGVVFDRDLQLYNMDTPAEVFVYEPKYLDRMPDFFKRAFYTWEEVAP